MSDSTIQSAQSGVTSAPTMTRQESARKSWRWYVSPRAWLRKIVHLDDSPHSIALGTSIGLFIALTPTVGIQMVLVLLLAWLCKPFFQFNRVAGLVAVYVSNPVTTVPIYWFNYWVGTFFVEGTVTREMIEQALKYQSLPEWWSSLCKLTFQFGWPLLLGSILVGILCAIPCYPITKYLARSIQQHRKKRLTCSQSEQETADESCEMSAD